ncbi:substrate-binding periplasmic protein [Undibacterium sp. Ji67W]|uniref:substrate-binding periplasmic protein n=1 Tax=Undibacterium sp. Ji67W TaxID=3413042 RepID=UPI003BF33619
MNRHILALFISLGLVSSAPVRALEKPAQLSFCYGDSDVYPWHMAKEQGLNFLMLNQVSSKLGIKFKYISYPWNRCMMEIKNGRVDGAFTASYVTERLDMGRYPMTREGIPDTDKRMMSESYFLYRLKNSKVDWDGKKFSNLNGLIGVTISASVVGPLKNLGVNVEEVSGKTEILFDMLMYGRLQGVITFTQVGDFMMRSPQYQDKFEKVPTPFVSKPYYLMLSHQMYANYPTLANQIWGNIAEVRESSAYKKAEQEANSGTPSN